MTNIIFSDLDGTLLNSKHQLTKDTAHAIRNRLAKGDYFIPVSARMPLAITKITDQIHSNLPLIAYNGALILNSKHENIFSSPISKETAISICKKIDEKYPELVWNIYSDQEKWYVKSINNPWTKKEIGAVNCQPLEINLKDFQFTSPIYKLLIQGPKEIKLQAKKEFKQLFSSIKIVNYGEITSNNADKGKAVSYFINKLPHSSIESYAFGDSENDLPMLRNVHHPYIMANASIDLKNQFQNTTLSNDQNGVAYVLNQLETSL